MIIDPALADVDPLRAALRADIRAEETGIVRRLAAEAAFSESARERVAARARALVEEVRRARVGNGGLDAFLQEFGLSSKEGVVLMCLAEALLRVPDAETVDRLIRDKIAEADWRGHLGHSKSLFVNASTWALMLTGRVVRLDAADTRDLAGTLKRLAHSSGEPVIRGGITQAMRILGRQFVMGRTIGEALARARDDEKRGYRHSYDMLGEAAPHQDRCRTLLRGLRGRDRRHRQGGRRDRRDRRAGGYRSSSPRCIRATTSRRGAAPMASSCRVCLSWRARPSATISA